MGSGRVPTHTVLLSPKQKGPGGKTITTVVGVGWETSNGGVNFVLNPGTVLDWRLGETHFMSVLPRKDWDNVPGPDPGPRPDPDQSEIPF